MKHSSVEFFSNSSFKHKYQLNAANELSITKNNGAPVVTILFE